MKFFKAFNLLHRRTKSDIFVSGSILQSATTDSEPPSRRHSVPVSLFDLVTSQIPANFKHFNDRGSGGGANVALPVLGWENELNARLIEANNRWAKEYANLQSQLQECREELHTERQKVRCLQDKVQEDNRIILDLRMSSRRFAGLLGVSNHATTDSPQDNTISGETGMLLDVTMPKFSNGSLANVMNIRTMDEYSSALRMTLATRKELRDQKKVTLFWKREALGSSQTQSAITPSVSTISSINDPLPVRRQIALDALISRRGFDSSQMEWKDTSASPPKMLPIDQSVSSSIAIARPAMSFPFSRLGPLASESIKAEISSLFGSPESIKYLVPRKRREPSHSISLIGRLTKSTSATPAKKTDRFSVESFGDLHTIFATTFGGSNGTLKEKDMDMDDDPSISMTSVLPPPISVSSKSAPTRSVLRTSNIPTRRGVVTSASTHNEVTANRLKQASKDCTSRRSWQSYKARPPKVKTVLEGNTFPKHAHDSPERDKENNFARAIPIFKRKRLSNSTQSNS